jgi:hypothetical protein
VRVRGVAADTDAFLMGRLCAQVEGYNLQCAARIRGVADRSHTEASPPFRRDSSMRALSLSTTLHRLFCGLC